MAPLRGAALAELVRDWVGLRPSVAALPALIGARIDRLGEREKQVLYTAAVIAR